MIKVFVSYRRDDSRHQAGRLYDHLVEHFGKEYIFKDVDSIPLGSDFREILTERVAGCDVFLAVIGDEWLSIAGSSGIRRLDDPGDFVRIEIEAALGRSIPVIPVLVGNSSVPKAEELPENLRELAYRNGTPVRPDPDFYHDVERLIRGIKAAVTGSRQPRTRHFGLVGLSGLLGVLAVILVGIIVYTTNNRARTKIGVDDPNGAAGKVPIRPDPTASGTAVSPEGPAPASVSQPLSPPHITPPLEKGPAVSSVVGTTSTKGGFQALFNGKDLAGWKVHPKQPGNWHVANGVLIGSGPALSHLYTERGDFADFHLRVEARFNKGGTSGVYLRCPFGPSLPSSEDPKWPDGFEATINNVRVVRNITGGLYPGVGNDVFIYDPPPIVPSGQWFTMEVIADGHALAVRVNGRPCAYKFDGSRLHRTGSIALQQYSPKTLVEFRTIDIKELNRPDQKDPREIRRFPAGTDPVTRVAFSPDGLGILSGGNSMEVMTRPGGGRFLWFNHNYEIRMWSVANGQNLFTKQGAGWIDKALALSSDGRYAASSENSVSEQPVLIWGLKTGKVLHKLMLKDRRTNRLCTALSFSADDRRVMVATTNGTVLSWDLVTEQEQPPNALGTGPRSEDDFRVADFTGDRQHLVTGSRTGVVQLWDLKSGKKLQTFAGHAGGIRIVTSSAEGRFILSAGSDSTVRLWDVASGVELKQLKIDDKRVRCIAFSPDSRRALSAGLDGPVHLWELANGEEVCRMEGHTMGVNSVAFSPDGRRAISGSDDRSVRLWQLPE